MKKITFAALCALSTSLAASTAFAQGCPPGSWLCAGVSVNAGFQVGTVPPPPPPPPQQVIVVEQAPVYVAPPPRVIVQQVPTYTYTTTTVTYLGTGRVRALGLGAYATGLGFGSRAGGSGGMGGGGAVMRYRLNPVFATELSIAGLVGTDYNGDSRAEVPLTVSGLVYFNPQNRFQVYGILGLGMSWAGVAFNPTNSRARGTDSASYTHFGGLAGLGLEWQLSPHFSIFGDARAFIRTRVDPERDETPEFTRVNSSGRTETTNVSVGVAGQLGGIFYF